MLGERFLALIQANFPHLTGYKAYFRNKKLLNDAAYLKAQIAQVDNEPLRMKLELCLSLAQEPDGPRA